MFARRSATVLSSRLCKSVRGTATGVLGVTASIQARVGSVPPILCSSQVPPSIQRPGLALAAAPMRCANVAWSVASSRSGWPSTSEPARKWVWASAKAGMPNAPLRSTRRVPRWLSARTFPLPNATILPCAMPIASVVVPSGAPVQKRPFSSASSSSVRAAAARNGYAQAAPARPFTNALPVDHGSPLSVWPHPEACGRSFAGHSPPPSHCSCPPSLIVNATRFSIVPAPSNSTLPPQTTRSWARRSAKRSPHRARSPRRHRARRRRAR